jgi:hypothetical protein
MKASIDAADCNHELRPSRPRDRTSRIPAFRPAAAGEILMIILALIILAALFALCFLFIDLEHWL